VAACRGTACRDRRHIAARRALRARCASDAAALLFGFIPVVRQKDGTNGYQFFVAKESAAFFHSE
jgi:hypothetical protein